MTKYKITIEDRIYEVQVEEIKGDSGAVSPQPVQATPQATPQVVPQSEPVAQPQAAEQPASGTKVQAPLSGDILSVKVKVGQQVSEGDVLLTLEALKLENEITAPTSGTIAEIVSEGTTVGMDQVIAIIS